MWERLVSIDPNHADAHFNFNLGIARHEQGDATGAVAALRRAAAIDPADSNAHLLYLSRVLHEQGDIGGCCAAIMKSTGMNPQ
jgi:tetratricopeptide (TPR) repeat protein